MSTTNQPEVLMTVTAVAGEEVKKFMQQEGVDPAVGGLRVSVQPGGCSGFKYGLLIAAGAFAWIAKAFREEDAGVRAQRDVVPAVGD